MGAFVDGPELRTAPTLPTTLTARYEGNGSGVSVTRYGNGFTGITPGSTDITEYTGRVNLTANFADNTISGCFGCLGGILYTARTHESATGEITAFENESTDYQIRLGAAQIEQDGTFRTKDVTLSNPNLRQAGLAFTSQSGSWGGKFSNIPAPDNTGAPRLAAGTFGGKAAYSDGTAGAYIGIFAADKQ